ncbi:MAG: hypothetical protein Fur0046_38310 [Cyanobacteria bacterium J069]
MLTQQARGLPSESAEVGSMRAAERRAMASLKYSLEPQRPQRAIALLPPRRARAQLQHPVENGRIPLRLRLGAAEVCWILAEMGQGALTLSG